MAKTKVKLMRDKAWKMFSLYIRLRDADEDGICTCCTCNARMEFDSADCQAGHFLSGRSNSVLLDDKVVHSQCEKCNMWHDGEQGKYLLFMKAKYSLTDEKLKDMLMERRSSVQIKEWQFREKIISYWLAIQGFMVTKFINREDIRIRIANRVKQYSVKSILEDK